MAWRYERAVNLISAQVINFNRTKGRGAPHSCVMCGKRGRPPTKGKDPPADDDRVVIPTQNKDVCKVCDTVTWKHNPTGAYFKWCKGCKRFHEIHAFAGKLKAMPPKLLSDDKQNIVIRPLAYCKEADLAAYAQIKSFPIIPCNLCGSQENLQRQAIKQMLQDWEKQFPGRMDSIFTAIGNVAPSQLADGDLFDFKTLKLQRPSLDKIRAVNLG